MPASFTIKLNLSEDDVVDIIDIVGSLNGWSTWVRQRLMADLDTPGVAPATACPVSRVAAARHVSVWVGDDHDVRSRVDQRRGDAQLGAYMLGVVRRAVAEHHDVIDAEPVGDYDVGSAPEASEQTISVADALRIRSANARTRGQSPSKPATTQHWRDHIDALRARTVKRRRESVARLRATEERIAAGIVRDQAAVEAASIQLQWPTTNWPGYPG